MFSGCFQDFFMIFTGCSPDVLMIFLGYSAGSGGSSGSYGPLDLLGLVSLFRRVVEFGFLSLIVWVGLDGGPCG